MSCFRGGVTGQKVEQRETLTSGQRQLLDALTSRLVPEVGQGVTPYQGERVAPFGSLQEDALDLTGGFKPGVEAGLKGFSQYDPAQAQGFVDTGERALSTALAPYDPAAATDFWETSWKRPAMETWREDVMPTIMEKGVRTAGTADSGPMRRELARSGETLTTNLSAQLANVLYGDRQAHMSRQLPGAQLAGALSQVPGQVAGQGEELAGGGLEKMTMMGGMEQAIRQQLSDSLQQKWLESQGYQNPWLTRFGPLALQTPAFENIGFQGAYQPSIFETLAGAGAAAGGAYFGAKSDKRLKENFAPIENSLEKVKQLKGLSYNFIGEDRRSAGIIAQELEKVLPEGVVEHHGVKYIKFDAAIGLLVNAINELNQKIDIRNN